MINYTNTILAEDYLELRAAVDWALLVKDQARSSIIEGFTKAGEKVVLIEDDYESTINEALKSI